MTLEEWIELIESIIHEREILGQFATGEWEKKFQREQLKINNDQLSMLKELQHYRNENKVQAEKKEENKDGTRNN